MKGAEEEVCGQEPLSHSPLALNRQQGLGPQPGCTHGGAGERERTGSGTLGVSRPTKKGKSIFNKPGTCVASSSSPSLC